MNLQDLRTLLDYHYWARDRMFAALEPLTPEQADRDLGSSFMSVRGTVTHLYAAEWAWYSRWQGTSPTALLPADEVKMRAYLEEFGEAGVDRVIEFKLLSGQPGAAPLWQMLQHVVNHASYHRGQVTTMLRQLGAQPPQSLDMIAFYRSQGPGADRS